MSADDPNPTKNNPGILAALLAGARPWSWDWTYNANLKEHFHALGVIAANYNELEGFFYRLFYLTLGKSDAGKIIFSKLNNAERIQVALKVAEGETLEFRDRYEHFISGFGTVAENRNILLHSKAHNAWPLDVSVSHLVLAKPSKHNLNENNFVSLDVTELRSVADDLHSLCLFGGGLMYWRYASVTGGVITWESGETVTPPLPDKPASPRKLALSPQPVLLGPSHQPETSGK